VSPFRYGFDPLCLFGCGAYALNRWVLKPVVLHPFLQGQWNDLWLIPCALPWLLWAQRWFGLRTHDRPPTAGEIGLHLVVWSVLCEVIGPGLMRVTGDPLDVLAYAAGALLAWVVWRPPIDRGAVA